MKDVKSQFTKAVFNKRTAELKEKSKVSMNMEKSLEDKPENTTKDDHTKSVGDAKVCFVRILIIFIT